MCALKNNVKSSLVFGNFVGWLVNWLMDRWTNGIIKLLYNVQGIFIFYFGTFQIAHNLRMIKNVGLRYMLILILSFHHIYYLAKVSVLF